MELEKKREKLRNPSFTYISQGVDEFPSMVHALHELFVKFHLHSCVPYGQTSDTGEYKLNITFDVQRSCDGLQHFFYATFHYFSGVR
jgi:hypothetical protein